MWNKDKLLLLNQQNHIMAMIPPHMSLNILHIHYTFTIHWNVRCRNIAQPCHYNRDLLQKRWVMTSLACLACWFTSWFKLSIVSSRDLPVRGIPLMEIIHLRPTFKQEETGPEIIRDPQIMEYFPLISIILANSSTAAVAWMRSCLVSATALVMDETYTNIANVVNILKSWNIMHIIL